MIIPGLADFYRRAAGQTLLNSYKPSTGRRTRVVVDTETGLPLIINTQNTRPIVEANKQAQSAFDPHRARRINTASSGMTRVASIPNVLWMRLKAMGITKDEKKLNEWLNRRDARFFRTDDCRRL